MLRNGIAMKKENILGGEAHMAEIDAELKGKIILEGQKTYEDYIKYNNYLKSSLQ